MFFSLPKKLYLLITNGPIITPLISSFNSISTENQNFDLELNESNIPPPLSLSAPELRSDQPFAPPLRRSASSTELLYEKAMQRFYQAVELEEAENERKRSMSVGPKSQSREQSHDFNFPNKKSLSFNEIEKRNSLKDSREKLNSPDAEREGEEEEYNEDSDSDTYESEWDEDEDDDRDIKKEILESQSKPIVNLTYEDDYTESTASTASVSAATSMESIEQFINTVRTSSTNIRNSIDDELETYHPTMEGRALSPYRSPEPGQAAIILNRPLSLPDPEYVPKPILKRPSNENTAKEADTKSPKPTNKSEKKGFLQLFGGKKGSTGDNSKSEESKNGAQNKNTGKPADAEREKVLQRQQSSIEENKVAIDHYGDLVRELGKTPGNNTRIPIYMRGNTQQEDDYAQSDNSEKLSEKGADVKSASPIEVRPNKPVETKLKTIDKEEKAKPFENNKTSNALNAYPMNNVAKLSPKLENLPAPVMKDMVEISVEHTQSISYSLREIKQEVNIADDVAKNVRAILPSDQPNANKTATGAIPKRKLRSASSSRSNSVTRVKVADDRRTSNASPIPAQIRPLSRTSTRSMSKSPASQTRTSISSTILKVTRLPLHDNYENIAISLSPSVSPEPRSQTPEQLLEEAEVKVKSSLNYATDVAMFMLACWVYLFKDARLAIPILVLMVYRQAQNAFKDKFSNWAKRKKT